MNTRLVIRVDANKEIALGHLKRCIALAEGLQQQGLDCLFVCVKDHGAQEVLKRASFVCEWVNTRINENNDAAQTLGVLTCFKASCIIIDSHNMSREYAQFYLNKGLALGYIDELLRTSIPSDIAINSTLGAEKSTYDAPLKLLGKDYLLLSKEYWSPPQPSIGKVENILITMGGIDHYDLSSMTLRILEENRAHFSVSVIIGPYYENIESIKNQQHKMSREVSLLYSPESLMPLFNTCDVVVSAGGGTLYEAATMGKPSIGISVWDIQRQNVTELGRQNVIVPLYYTPEPSFEIELKQNLFGLIDDMQKRRALSITGQKHFDGKGSVRAAHMIATYLQRKR